ncbi:hypothetical protein ACTQ49_02765 [Luteococcus sp. Sow4_B9]|uniref:hypothetical protein n=1 Tax=Luteococcus sp. Sow4_B9 TaxID=3438792 RepID=UPI003F9E0753
MTNPRPRLARPGLRLLAHLTLGALALGSLTACSGSAPTPEAPSPTPTRDASSRPATPDHAAELRALVPGLLPRAESFPQQAPKVSTPGPRVDISVPAAEQAGGHVWQESNVGLSFEATELADQRWEPDGSTLTPLLLALDKPSLRFGGNSVDRRMWWTSRQKKAPDWASATVTPDDLARLARMAERVDATVTLVVDLGHFDPDRAADMAAHAHRALGSRLKAVSIGNEPNGFFMASQARLSARDSSWSPEHFVAQARVYEKAIHARTPNLPLAGPGTFDAKWWRAFAQAKLPQTTAMSQHWYPLWSCPNRKGATDPRAVPTVQNITSPWLHQKAATMVGMAQETAASHNLPLWLEETGPTCTNCRPCTPRALASARRCSWRSEAQAPSPVGSAWSCSRSICATNSRLVRCQSSSASPVRQ